MKNRLAFVGDVHGNLGSLSGILQVIYEENIEHVVFLGDYLNKGPNSAEVLEQLLTLKNSGQVTLLAGNHESTLLEALDNRDLAPFLKIGGASTIRSYLGGNTGADVYKDFCSKLPQTHIDGLRSMPSKWVSPGLIAQHEPIRLATARFKISAHSPVGKVPIISNSSAQIDTGASVLNRDGRLTAFIWPDRHYVQVDENGVRIT